jgi:hypothetical protein
MQTALMWLNLYGWETVRHKLKNRQKCIFCVLGCFWAYVGQPHDQIDWATSMPFPSINSTNPRTNLWNFREIFLRIGDFEKLSFFESAILNFFFKKKIKFASFPWKSVHNQLYSVCTKLQILYNVASKLR